MIEQKDSIWWHKLNGVLRLFIVKNGCKFCFKSIILNEYPKSGGSWIGQMLSASTGMVFPRNRLPVWKDSIIHGHYYNTFGLPNTLIVWRDGRDVIVSQYYHWLFENDKGNTNLVKQCRKDLNFDDYNDILKNLPKFIEYIYVQKKHPKYSWSDFVNRWKNKNVVFVKYEDMRIEPILELTRITQELTSIEIDKEIAYNIIEKYSFRKQSGRKEGEADKNSFMRKGIVGDWKNQFTDEAKNVFKKYAGKELILLGYEKDLNW